MTKKAKTRICRLCGKEFPLNKAHFAPLGRGFRKDCRKCAQPIVQTRPTKRKTLAEQNAERKAARLAKPKNYKEGARKTAKKRKAKYRQIRREARDVDLADVIEENAPSHLKAPEKPEPGFNPVSQEALARAERKRKLRKATVAEVELAKRTLARRRLLPFIQKFNRNYQAGWVHEHICRQLERFVKRVERKESPRLMIFMPPRHGKSEIASKNFPAWLLGHHPDWEIIASSYAVSLPIGFSRKVQSTIQDPAYKQLFPKTALHPKAQSAEAWMTTMEGGYVAAGVGGGITGKGAHVFIIDDPVKDAEEADSSVQRDKVWDWWGSTAKTRLAPGGGVLVIQTRWHDDDLSGRLLSQMKALQEEFQELLDDAQIRYKQLDPNDSINRTLLKQEILQYQRELEEIDRWEVIIYPAIATQDEYVDEDGLLVHDPTDQELAEKKLVKVRSKGEALHEERYPLPRLRNMRRSMQPRHWAALYQQNPVPEEGLYFTKDMIRYTASIPPTSELYLFSAWDLAVGERQQNDYTVGVVGGLDWQGQVHILEMLRFRANIHESAAAIMSVFKKYPDLREIGIEKGQLELAIMPELDRLMRKERLYPTFNHDLRPITDKLVRARPLQGMMQRGLVLFPQNQPWTESAESELLRFPGGVHDDIVDALAWLIRMIGNQKEPPKPGTQRHRSWKKRLNQILAEQHRLNDPMGA